MKFMECQDNLENDEYEIRFSGIINSNFKSFSFDILIQSRRRYGIIIIDDSNKANINELFVHLSYLERIEVYAIFVLVFDRSKCIEQYVIRLEYNTDKSIISLIYFNHRYFSTSPSEISSKISNVVNEIKTYERRIDSEEVCSLLKYMSPSLSPSDSFFLEHGSKAEIIRTRLKLEAPVSFIEIIKYITRILANEILRNSRYVKEEFLQQVLGLTRKIPNYHPPESLFFDFCLAYLGGDYTDAKLFLDHSKYLLGIPYYFRLLLYKITHTPILRNDNNIKKFVAMVARTIQPMSAKGFESEYGEEYFRRYAIYSQVVLSIDNRLLSVF